MAERHRRAAAPLAINGRLFVLGEGTADRIGAGMLGLEAGIDELAVPLLATQILWINLVTDSGLALALGVDPTIDDLMADLPRRIDDRMIDLKMGRVVGLTGLTVALSALFAFDLELVGGLLEGTGDLTSARTHAFTTVVLACAMESML